MNITEKITFNTDKPTVLSIKKTEKINLFAVGLLEKQILAKHKTMAPATLMVVRGKIDFYINGETIILREQDVFEIPVEIEHEVMGRDFENIFIILKEL